MSVDTDKRKNRASILQILEVWNYLEIDTLKELQLLTIKEQLLYYTEVKDSFGCSEKETVRFQVLGEATRQRTELQP